MAVQDLVKGELDWHEKMNANMHELQSEVESASGNASAAVETAEGAKETAEGIAENLGEEIAKKLSKAPKTAEMEEGYVFQKSDGTTELREAEEPTGPKFKYTIITDNGADGAPGAVEYYDDCFGFTEAKGTDLGDWANAPIMDYFKPCVIQPGDGAPSYFLQKDNRRKKEDGTDSVLTGADGDVMIQVKKLYGKFLKSENRLKISVSNVKEDDTWFCFNDIAGKEKEYTYRGVYKAGVVSGATTIMRSISGVAPLISITRATGRTYARNRGRAQGYHQNNFFLLMLWQVMYLMMYKNRDSQTCLGQGRSLSSNTAASTTGWSNDKPFCWGDRGGVNGVVFLGVEDFYGNIWEWVDGVTLVNQIYKITRDPEKYDDTGSSYEIYQASGCTSDNSNKYITKVQGTNDAGFLPAGSGGSSTTYWCDNMWTSDATRVVRFGGYWPYAAHVGAFCWDLYDTASVAYAYIGSRLCRG